MRPLLRTCTALLLAAALASACGLVEKPGTLLADHVMVGTLLASPPVTLAAGADAGVTVPGQSAALVVFAQRAAGELTSAPQLISQARVTVGPVGGEAVALPPAGEGRYARTWSEDGADGGVPYTPGAAYTFAVVHDTQRFEGRVDDAPEREAIAELHPAAGFVALPAGSPLTLTRPPAPAGRERTLGFVTVVPVSGSGARGTPTWTNVPADPLALLQLVAAPAAWKQDRVTIPGEAFPERGATYLVTFHAVRSGGPATDNLFAGSALLVGTADVGAVRTND